MRGRKPFPKPDLPPKGHFRVSCEAIELLKDERIGATDLALYVVLSMFAWDGEPVRVTVETLAEWIRVSREAASRSLGRLAREGLIRRLPDGRISVIHKSRDFGKSRDSTITEIHPVWRSVAARIGVESGDGLRALVQSGIPPRRLLALWEHHRRQPGAPGVGAFLVNLRENPEGMATLADRLLAAGHSGPPICPLCGADAGRSSWDRRSWRDECPACGARIRECPRCREPAPADGPCPWCGEPPEEGEVLVVDAEAEVEIR